MNNFTGLQLLKMMEFSFNTLSCLFPIAFLLKSVSDFTTDASFLWKYLLKNTLRRTKILVSPVWNQILKIWDTIFELIQIEVQCSQNEFITFLPQDAWAFGNKIEKEMKKTTSKVKKKICILYIYREYSLYLQFNANDSFLQKCINF